MMGKRSEFPRVERDAYDTPPEAVAPLLPHLQPGTYFIDPCAGAGALLQHLSLAGHICCDAFDIAPRIEGVDQLDFLAADIDHVRHGGPDTFFITNPPWRRPLLHAFIERARDYMYPAWLLIDANASYDCSR